MRITAGSLLFTALFSVIATNALEGQTFVKTQTISYVGNAPNFFSPTNFGTAMVASGGWLAALATAAPEGGPLNIPFLTRYPVFVYRYESQRWEPEAVLYEQITENVPAGFMTLSGSRIVHGIPNLTVDAFSIAGRVWSYVADPTWRREAEIRSPEPRAGAYFGSGVALEGETLAVLATGSGALTSAIYLYSFAEGTWNHVQTLAPPTPFRAFQTIAMNPNWLAAATFENSGAVFLYQRGSGGWELKQTLVPPSGGSFGGHAVAIGPDMLAVPSARETIGRIYVFKLVGESWSLTQQLDASDRTECTYLGTSISMTTHKLLVGASNACVNGMQNAGLARLYLRTGDAWTKAADFMDDTPAQGEQFAFGMAVGPSHAFMGVITSQSNFTAGKIDVYGVPADPTRHRRAMRP